MFPFTSAHGSCCFQMPDGEKNRALIPRLLFFFSLFSLLAVSLSATLPLLLGLCRCPWFGSECLVWTHVPDFVLASAQSTCLHMRATGFYGCCRFLPPKKGFPCMSCLSPSGTLFSRRLTRLLFVYQGGSSLGKICVGGN